jgi:hypothetical protein
MKAGKRRKRGLAPGQLFLLAVISIGAISAFLLFTYIETGSYLTRNTVALVNDTTSRIIWIGSSQACIPYINGTHMVTDCFMSGDGYTCSGIQYALSENMLSGC